MPSGFFRHPKKKSIFLVDTSAAFLAKKVSGQRFYLGRGKINGRKWILAGRNQRRPKTIKEEKEKIKS
jgi:hypothetical protein